MTYMAKETDLMQLINDLDNSKVTINRKYDLTEDTDPRIEDDLYIEDVYEYINKLDTLNTKNATAEAQYILEGKTLYVNKVKVTGTLKGYTSNPVYPGKEDKVIAPAGVYIKEQIAIKGDRNLNASNIKSGINLFGISGSYANPAGINLDTTTNVTANDVAKGKTIYTYNTSTNAGVVITGLLDDYRSEGFALDVKEYKTDDEFVLRIPVDGIYDSSSYTMLTENKIKQYVTVDPSKIRKGKTILGVTGTAEAGEI